MTSPDPLWSCAGDDPVCGPRNRCCDSCRWVRPKRIQITRSKPWRADNPEAVRVDRRTRWGNPFRIGQSYRLGYGDAEKVVDAATAVRLFRRWLNDPHRVVDAAVILAAIPELRGKDLACWCPLDAPCHADVLLELANAPAPALQGEKKP